MEKGLEICCQKCGANDSAVEPIGEEFFAVYCQKCGNGGPVQSSRAEAIAA